MSLKEELEQGSLLLPRGPAMEGMVENPEAVKLANKLIKSTLGKRNMGNNKVKLNISEKNKNSKISGSKSSGNKKIGRNVVKNTFSKNALSKRQTNDTSEEKSMDDVLSNINTQSAIHRRQQTHFRVVTLQPPRVFPLNDLDVLNKHVRV